MHLGSQIKTIAMFIERNNNRIKRRQHFWFALLLSRQSSLWLTERKKKKSNFTAKELISFKSDEMSLLEKCRRDCTGQPGDGLCRAVIPGGLLHFPASQQCSWRGEGMVTAVSAVDKTTASDRQGTLCSPAARQGHFKIPGLIWDCQCPPLHRLAGY